MTDDETLHLVTRFRAGDQTAAAVLFDRYFARIRALVRDKISSKLARRIDSEDIAQSAIKSFFGGVRKDQITLSESGDTWRMLAHIALKKVHRKAKHHSQQKRAMNREEHGPDIQGDDWLAVAVLRGEPDHEEAVAICDELIYCMSRFPTRRRPIIELRLQGHAIHEIAGQLRCSEHVARTTWDAFRTLVKSRLREESARDDC